MKHPKLSLAALTGLFMLLISQLSMAGAIHGKTFKDWQGRCEKQAEQPEVCYVVQTLAEKEKPPVMITAVGFRPNEKEPIVIFTLSAALDATKDIQFKIDKNEPIGLQAQCDGKQCRVGFRLDKRMMGEFRKGVEGVLAFIIKDTGKPAYFSVSLRGFTKALNTLKKG